jgi:5-hydroxyisourate hydrolase-like protein (transthyretin family)
MRTSYAMLVLLAAAPLAWAGYRNVDQSTGAPVSGSPTAPPAAAWGEAEILKTNGQRLVVGKSRVFHQQKIEANETIRLRIQRPDLREGEKVFVYTINGGRVNGAIATNLPAGAGKLEFDFKAGEYFGNYPVVLRCRGQESSIEFWVGDKTATRKVTP